MNRTTRRPFRYLPGAVIQELAAALRALLAGSRPGAVRRGTVRFPAAVGSVLLAAVVAALGGCGGREAAERGVVELRAWTMWGGEEADAFQVAVDAFNRTHPGIRVRNLPAVDDTKIIRAIVADDPPEIFTLREPGYLGSLAANGALRLLDDDFRASGLREEAFAPGSLDQCRYRGKLYAQIYLMDCYGLLWNQQAFEDAGLDPGRPPETMEQLLETAARLTKRNAQGRVERLGLLPPEPTQVIAAFGGKFVDPETGRATAVDPRNVEAMEWYRRLIEAQGGAEEVNAFVAGFGDEMGVNNPFLIGKTAMLFGGQWNPYWFQKWGPNVRYSAAPLPHPEARPELKRPTWIGGNLFCIPANCRHPREAWEFLRWTQTPEAQVLFAQTMHGVPNILAARSDPSLRSGEPWKKAFAVFMDAATSPNSRFFPVTPVTGLYQYELINAADFVRYGSRTPREALAGVQQRVDRELQSWQ